MLFLKNLDIVFHIVALDVVDNKFTSGNLIIICNQLVIC